MERVAFLIEQSGERVFAMINPDELTFERQSGVSMRKRHERPLASARRTDDPMIYVGGGVTELKLNLLFDVDLLSRSSPSFAQAPDFRTNLQAPPAHARTRLSIPQDSETAVVDADTISAPSAQLAITDVRELSGPLWRLTENGVEGAVTDGPSVVHFIWGAAWNVPCIAISVAERFDQFAADGTPLRSWVRIHLRRTHLPMRRDRAPGLSLSPQLASSGLRSDASLPESVVLTDTASSSRPDTLCDSIYGDMRLLHPLLDFNGIDDFWSLDPGFTLMTPPASVLREQAP